MRVRVLLNATSETARQAEQAICAGDACETDLIDPADFAGRARAAVDDGVERIVIGGGDGSIHAVVNALAPDFAAELAIIPLGTANDLARILDVPNSDISTAIQLALRGRAALLDLIRVVPDDAIAAPRYGVNACIGGVPGTLAVDMDPDDKRRWGALAYWITAAKKLGALTSHALRIEADGEQIELSVFGLAISNGRYAGGAFPVAPGAWADDGLIDLTVIPAEQALETFAAGLNLLFGNGAAESTNRRQARAIRVAAAPPLPFSIDGEALPATDALFEVVPSAIRVVAGPAAIGLASQVRSVTRG